MDGQYTSLSNSVTKDNILSMFHVETVVLADNVSLAAASATSYANSNDYTPPTVEGYTPLALVGFYLQNATNGGTNLTYVFVNRMWLDENTNKVGWCIRNEGSAAAKVKIFAKILYVRDPTQGE